MSRPPRNIELEHLVIDTLRSTSEDAPERQAAWEVYADWLLSRGEPVGEWLAASVRADAGGSAGAPVRARLGEIERATRFRLVDLELADLSEVPELERVADFTWERGFITAAALRCQEFRAWDSELLHHTPDRLLDVVLRSPSACLLHSLALDQLEFAALGSRFSSFIELLAAVPGPLGLRSAKLGNRHHCAACLPELLTTLPELRALELSCAEATLDAPLRHAQLTEFVWSCSVLERSSRVALGASQLETLRRLVLHVRPLPPEQRRKRVPSIQALPAQSAVEPGATLDELEGLWSGALAPALRELDIDIEGASEAIVHGLLSGSSLDQLTHLHLRGLEDEAALLILAAPARFTALERCELSGPLSPRTRAALHTRGLITYP